MNKRKKILFLGASITQGMISVSFVKMLKEKLEPDPLADYEVCPPRWRICLDKCPQEALTGETVIQKRCRPLSTSLSEKGYTIKKCFECRKDARIPWVCDHNKYPSAFR